MIIVQMKVGQRFVEGVEFSPYYEDIWVDTNITNLKNSRLKFPQVVYRVIDIIEEEIKS